MSGTINTKDYFQPHSAHLKNRPQKGINTMTFIGFILEQVAKVLDWTNDAFEASIIREIASHFPQLLG